MENKIHFRLHWTCDSPSPYNDFLFKTIHDEGNFDLNVHYRYDHLSSHPWKAPLRIGYKSRVQNRILGIDWVLIFKALFDREAIFLLGGWADSTSLSLIIFCILLKRKYFLWTDTPNLGRKRCRLYEFGRNVFLRFAFRNACGVLGTGRPAIGALLKMGVAEDKLINFPYWIDLDAYGAKESLQNDPCNSFLRFVSSGRLVNFLKGHDLAIRALAKALKKTPALHFEYIIAGTGPDAKKIKELADHMGIGQKVRLVGWVEPHDLVKIFHNSDVLIHASPVHEPYGVAVVEAMAAGLIVLASDVTSAALDRIKPGVNGFIHKAGDVDELATQILWLINNPQRMLDIKREARKTAEEWPIKKGIETIKNILFKCAAS